VRYYVVGGSSYHEGHTRPLAGDVRQATGARHGAGGESGEGNSTGVGGAAGANTGARDCLNAGLPPATMRAIPARSALIRCRCAANLLRMFGALCEEDEKGAGRRCFGG